MTSFINCIATGRTGAEGSILIGSKWSPGDMSDLVSLAKRACS